MGNCESKVHGAKQVHRLKIVVPISFVYHTEVKMSAS